MNRTNALLDGLALRGLAERYAVAVDRGDSELFCAQFAPQGMLIAPRGTFAGRASLATVPSMMRGLYLRTFHAVLNQVPVIDGDSATAETYCIARHIYRDEADRLMCYEMSIRYQDTFDRIAGDWLIARRELVVDASCRFPLDDLNAGEGDRDG